MQVSAPVVEKVISVPKKVEAPAPAPAKPEAKPALDQAIHKAAQALHKHKELKDAEQSEDVSQYLTHSYDDIDDNSFQKLIGTERHWALKEIYNDSD